ncbi:hypothetical protein LTR85_005512 [Meristemomyces frigidus]|nr:hypothetical protein LTR85_005512 [Meristemomyces frigidus]
MAKRAVPAPKRDWIKANKQRVKNATDLKGKALDAEMEVQWKNSGLSRHAVAVPAAPVDVAPAPAAPAPAVNAPVGQPAGNGGPGEQEGPGDEVEPTAEMGAPELQEQPDEAPGDGVTGDHTESHKRTQETVESGDEAQKSKKRKRLDGAELKRDKPFPYLKLRNQRGGMSEDDSRTNEDGISKDDGMGKDDGLRRAEVEDTRKREALSSIPDQPDGSHWQGGQFLGSGAFGTACLWFEFDAANRITNRVVVKDCYVAPEHWSQIRHWRGDPRKAEEREHVEIAAMKLVNNRPGSQNIVHLIAFNVDDRRRWYRIYVGFCPHGSLQDLILYYRPPEYINFVGSKGEIAPEAEEKRKRWRLRAGRMLEPDDDDYDSKAGDREESIPEAFLWSLFESLAEACIVLETGGLEAEDAIARWDTGDGAIFQSYPRARLGDFGLALITSDTDILNPTAYNGDEGTQGWQAPEQCYMINPTTGRQDDVGKLLSPANVWAIGATIICLMNRCIVCNGTQYDSDIVEPIIDPVAVGRYSDRLLHLARRCVRYWPDDRISLRTLRQQIQAFSGLGGRKQDVAEKMRFREHGEGDLRLHLEYEKDQYKIGFSLQQPKDKS